MSDSLFNDNHPAINFSTSTLGMPPSPTHEHAGDNPRSRGEPDTAAARSATAFLDLHARSKQRQQDADQSQTKQRPAHITLPDNNATNEKGSPSYPPSQNESQVRLTDAHEDQNVPDDLPDDVYIPTSETYGLPRRDKNAFRKQAQAIIAARRLESLKTASHKGSRSLDTSASTNVSDDEDSPGGFHVPKGAGVLGSLSTFESQQLLHKQSHHKTALEYYKKDKKRPNFKAFSAGISSGIATGFDKARSRWEGETPSAFASLAAAGMDLGGAAAPEGTSVRPDPARRGYHINRWSLQSSAEGSPSASPSNPRHTQPTTPELEHVAEKLKEHKAQGGDDYFALAMSNNAHKKAASESSWDLSSSLGRMGFPTPGGHRSGRSSPRPEKGPKKPNKQELWITRHIASVLERQEFILQLARACMLFGAPTHALEEHIEDTARVLDVTCQSVLILSFMVISFKDDYSQTSTIRIIKQSTALDLGKLRALSYLHKAVIKDQISVSEASDEISGLMLRKPFYGMFTSCALGAACSICISQPSFNASFIDLLVIAPLGAFVILAQSLTARYFKRFNSVLEVLLTGTVSFAACALSATSHFCFASVLSGSIVLLLPGWLVCQSALELQNRSITSGSIRLVWTLIYALFLGFGISLGATIWIYAVPDRLMPVDPTDTTCSTSHGDKWWNQTINPYFSFLFVPLYPVFLALKNQAKFTTKEFVGSALISICGWVVNHFSAKHFPNRADLTSVLGAATVGLASSCWSKAFEGPSFIVAVCAIMFQLPSGLSNGGLLSFATTEATDNASAAFSNLFSVAEQLLIVALGLVVGLFTSTALFSLAWSIIMKKKHMKAKDLVSF